MRRTFFPVSFRFPIRKVSTQHGNSCHRTFTVENYLYIRFLAEILTRTPWSRVRRGRRHQLTLLIQRPLFCLKITRRGREIIALPKEGEAMTSDVASGGGYVANTPLCNGVSLGSSATRQLTHKTSSVGSSSRLPIKHPPRSHLSAKHSRNSEAGFSFRCLSLPDFHPLDFLLRYILFPVDIGSSLQALSSERARQKRS